MPSGHMVWPDSPIGTALLLHECFFFFNKENVRVFFLMFIQTSDVLKLLCLLNQIYVGCWDSSALRRRRARRWWWAAAGSWSGSSCSDGEWPSPGPPRIPWGRWEAWWAPALRSRCSNAARNIDRTMWILNYPISFFETPKFTLPLSSNNNMCL